ncbi:RNA polymerase sigma-70 factor [Sunxiuqinia sp. A32]|uniref:RNA polymerase sigma-70 factor n=1 Tax=Sunxiuqinia sp. A32 TaxID=3461496 RepID=UPI0040462225
MEESSGGFQVGRLKSGSIHTFETIFCKYYKPLCYYAKKFKLDHFESEEVVQQVFLKFWEIRESLTIEKSISSYLYQSVRNQSINHLKQKLAHQKNREELFIRVAQAELFAQISEEDGTSAIIAKELEQEIFKAIDTLPEKCREIFLLSRKENLSIKEIANRLNVSTNTVQKQISIALSKLRELLKYSITVVFVFVGNFF